MLNGRGASTRWRSVSYGWLRGSYDYSKEREGLKETDGPPKMSSYCRLKWP